MGYRAFIITQQTKLIGFAAVISFCVSILGCHEKKNPTQLKNEVIANEEPFRNLVEYFSSTLPDSNHIVIFGFTNGTVSLTYYVNEGNIANRDHFGGTNLKLHSPELDKAIKDLGWSYKTIDSLSKGLEEVQCDYIRNTDWFGHPINIYNSPNGFINSDYNIYPTDMLDTVRVIHGEPIGQTIFLRRVYVMTASAL